MTNRTPTVADEIARYIETGDTDPYHEAWTGRSFLERACRAHDDLRAGLVAEVKRRAAGRTHVAIPHPDSVALTRAKVEPMVRGLFPRSEQELVLATLERSVIFVTSDNIEQLLTEKSFDHSAWMLANLYLASVGAEPFSDDGVHIVGMSEGTTCYVSPAYFEEDDPFADFVVHEAAHIFHNCKRETIGLPSTRTREWLLTIDYRERETFAYASEAYARILERAKNPAERRTLAELYRQTVRLADDRADGVQVAGIVAEAAVARNGWKVILSRCAPPPARRLSA